MARQRAELMLPSCCPFLRHHAMFMLDRDMPGAICCCHDYARAARAKMMSARHTRSASRAAIMEMARAVTRACYAHAQRAARGAARLRLFARSPCAPPLRHAARDPTMPLLRYADAAAERR